MSSDSETVPIERGPVGPEATGAAEPAEAAPPEIEGYEILELLGRGGMGEVHRAQRVNDTGIAVQCVVKTVRESWARNPSAETRFLDEARLIASLRHPNIVSVLDVGRAAGGLYLAMEWVDGPDALALVERAEEERTPIPLTHVLFILRETLQGLHHAHTATDAAGAPLGIVHRDISPGNVLISRQGAVKLADFGIALGATNESDRERGRLQGKVHYFSPEVILGEEPSVRSDLFALGATFYELLTGERLVDVSLAPLEALKALAKFDPERLLEHHLTLPDGVDAILLRALAPRPGDRYATALEFLEDVNDFAFESGLRLLDAHFASYVDRVTRPAAPGDGDARPKLFDPKR